MENKEITKETSKESSKETSVCGKNNTCASTTIVGLKDLSEVVKAAKPTIPTGENGFMPLKEFDPKKVYQDMADLLKIWQSRIDSSVLNPEQMAKEVSACAQHLSSQYEELYKKLLATLENCYRDRTNGLGECHGKIESFIKAWRDEWKASADKIEGKYDTLLNIYIAEIKSYYDARIAAMVSCYDKRIDELKNHYNELKNETEKRIDLLQTSEKELKEKIGKLEGELVGWLNERSEWLKKREENFEKEKELDRTLFNNLRTHVTPRQSENPDWSASQILAGKFNWVLVWVPLSAIVLAAVLIAGFAFKWGLSGDSNTSKGNAIPCNSAQCSALKNYPSSSTTTITTLNTTTEEKK